MLYTTSLDHPRKQGAFAIVDNPLFRPAYEAVVDVGVGNGRADGLNMGSEGNGGPPFTS